MGEKREPGNRHCGYNDRPGAGFGQSPPEPRRTILDGELREYYARRAPSYDEIYRKPERQEDLRRLREYVVDALTGHSVLEIACGTGYWTELVAPVATRVLATDIDPGLLERAAHRVAPNPRVEYAVADAYHPDGQEGGFTAGLAAFWWSHVPVKRLARFLDSFHRRLDPGALVVFIDNRYAEGSSTDLTRSDADGNTYQTRRLETGETYEIIKNFPTAHDLRSALPGGCHELRIVELPYYWFLAYRLVAEGGSERGPDG